MKTLFSSVFASVSLLMVSGSYIPVVIASEEVDVPSVIKGKDLITNTPMEFKLGDQKQISVLIFLSANCPCSKSHEPLLEKLSKEFKGSGFQFIGIHSNTDEKMEDAAARFHETGITFPVIEDHRSQIAIQMSALKTPHVYIVSKDKKVLFQGGVDDSHHGPSAKKHYLQDALTAIREDLQALRPVRPVANNNVRTLGCVIKRPE